MSFKVGIFGATGMVGETMRKCLEERRFPVGELRLFASERSEGETKTFHGQPIKVEILNESRIKGLDLVLASLPATSSLVWNRFAANQGAWVVDNSSAFRMDSKVALVIPEVNGDVLDNAKSHIVANPNCSTIQMLVALNQWHKKAGVKRIVVSTYQASSGKGAEAVNELTDQALAFGRGEEVMPAAVHADRLFGNLLTGDWAPSEGGFNEEEFKIIQETRKIWADDSVAVAPTTVRVPVWNAHSESIAVELKGPLSLESAIALLKVAPGVKFAQEPKEWMPIHADGKDDVFVGRVRVDPSCLNGFLLWVVADNLRKGAALNAVQIAELLHRKGLLNAVN